jgi:micrococcal nuclease
MKKLLILLLIFTPILSFAQDKVKLNRVIDGDTIKIERNGKKESVRLIGVDTPESRKNKKSKKRRCAQQKRR